MINKTVIKLWIAYVLCITFLVTVGVVMANRLYPKVKSEILSYKQHQGIDCHKVKETCDRKKGCKCKLNCDSEGKRLPPSGGTAECPSFCCEEKCECHAMGCP